MTRYRIFSIVWFLGCVSGWILIDRGWLWLMFSVAIYLAVVGIASFNIQLNFFTRSIRKTSSQNVLLTFDDGIDSIRTPLILDILKAHDAKAMFFIIGKKVKGNEEILKRMIREGHLIGGHSYSHSPFIGFFSFKRLYKDVQRGQNTLEEVIGEKIKFYRPPMGVTNPIMHRVFSVLELKPVAWSIRSLDTVRNPKHIIEKVLGQVSGGDVVLLHDNRLNTVQSLPSLLEGIQKMGLTIQAELYES